GNLADANLAGDRRISREGLLLLPGDKFQSADKTGRVSGGEQLLGIGGFTSLAAQFARRSQFHIENAIGRNGAAVTASGGSYGGGVKGLDALHENSPV